MSTAPARREAWVGAVLDFWFARAKEDWWRPSDAFDDEIRERFAIEWARQSRRPVADFTGDAETALAAVVLFDQFPRNMFRGHADQFATDHLALAIAKAGVDRGLDEQLQQPERGFLYMPFQHSENLADQKRSLQLFIELGDDYQLGYAQKHHDVIARFGRFPHRNAILGRAPRPSELAEGKVEPW